MSKTRTINEILEELKSIDEECSEIDEDSQSEGEDEDVEFSNIFIHEIGGEYENESSNTEEEEILIANRGRKRMRLISDSEDEGEEIAMDGTVWKKIDTCSTPGRRPLHTIFKGLSGPTGHAKRNIMKGSVSSAFYLLFDNHMMEHIIKSTEAEARRVLGKEWSLSRNKLEAFIAILYIRSANEQKNVDATFL
ncbi:uncharacterized protein LOC129946523 [Eupeodes corollae]|uniref:uncharacterized protein LOC129946523 n=1 Tax=Eupeodes corollae TaxID=290404 RepID=UPI00249180D5|nr:uncharacterized protein LOC129946523 [Eupeodes corollae]